MLILFLFTAILACITTRLIVYFFQQGTTVMQLLMIVLMLTITMLLVGYLRGSFNIPLLDTLIIK